MEKTAIARLLLLLVAVTIPGAVLPLPAAAGVANVAWVEDGAVGILQLQAESAAAPLAMALAAAAGGVDDDHDVVVHRRVLQARRGGYLNPSLLANQQRCIGNCYTGRGNKCIYHNRSC
uniref:Uncharacterized protein n=1 Tax=Leersia perrieri TaxID=77586 RepID=A0A0D9W460_9ORYZ